MAFRRVTAWFADHPTVIPGSGTSAAALQSQVDALKQIVASMTARATEQTTQASQATLASKDETAQRSELRQLHLKAIVKIAGGLRGKVPGMSVFKMPAPRLSSESLLHAAQATRTTAAVYKDVFVEHGLPADFLDQLDAATAALESSVDARGMAQSRRAGASTGLVGDLTLGRQIVSMIDASLTHALKSDSALFGVLAPGEAGDGEGSACAGGSLWRTGCCRRCAGWRQWCAGRSQPGAGGCK